MVNFYDLINHIGDKIEDNIEEGDEDKIEDHIGAPLRATFSRNDEENY